MMTYSFLQVFGLIPDIGRYIFNELNAHNHVLHDLGSDVPKVYNKLFFRQSGHITNFRIPTCPSFFFRQYGILGNLNDRFYRSGHIHQQYWLFSKCFQIRINPAIRNLHTINYRQQRWFYSQQVAVRQKSSWNCFLPVPIATCCE